MNREDVEQHHLTRSELDVDGFAFVHFARVNRDAENQVVGFLPDVVSRLPRRMGARKEAQASVRAQAVENGNPDGCRRKWLHGGMAGVAVPWRGGARERT